MHLSYSWKCDKNIYIILHNAGKLIRSGITPESQNQVYNKSQFNYIVTRNATGSQGKNG